MAAKRNISLLTAANVAANTTGPWVDLQGVDGGAYVVVKAGAFTAGTLTAVIETSPENDTPNAPVLVVGSLVLDTSNLIRVSDQTTKKLARYGRVVLTSAAADFDDVEVYLQF